MFYTDTSAAMMLVVAESDSRELQLWIERVAIELFSSDLLRTELVKAVRRSAPSREKRAHEVLDTILLVEIPTSVFDRAATVEPPSLRSLDAVHLAAAMDVGDALKGIVTYDDRLSEAASAIGIPVIEPH